MYDANKSNMQMNLPMALGLSILAANKPSRAPNTFGSVLGQGGLNALQVMQQQQAMTLKQQQAKAAIEHRKYQRASSEARAKESSRRWKIGLERGDAAILENKRRYEAGLIEDDEDDKARADNWMKSHRLSADANARAARSENRALANLEKDSAKQARKTKLLEDVQNGTKKLSRVELFNAGFNAAETNALMGPSSRGTSIRFDENDNPIVEIGDPKTFERELSKDRASAVETADKAGAKLDSTADLIQSLVDIGEGGTGVRGAVGNTLGGVVGQVAGADVAQGLNKSLGLAAPEATAKLKQQVAMSIAQSLATMTGDTSGRYTDFERKLAEEARSMSGIAKSHSQIVAVAKDFAQIELLDTFKKHALAGQPIDFNDPKVAAEWMELLVNKYHFNEKDLEKFEKRVATMQELAKSLPKPLAQ